MKTLRPLESGQPEGANQKRQPREGVHVDESRPIFVQIAEQIVNDIISGALPEESQVPSTNEYAAFYRINPATVGKGVNVLVDSTPSTR